MGVALGRRHEVDKVMHQIGEIRRGVILGSMCACGFRAGARERSFIKMYL